ncbi:MAG: hypothetical protein AAF202_03555 [Pseudomonadota bacterium]
MKQLLVGLFIMLSYEATSQVSLQAGTPANPTSAHSESTEFEFFQNELLPFTSDGCSRFPDSIGKTSWESCCKEHDLAYWAGGTREQRYEADEALKQCVREVAPGVLGPLMEIGVNLGGAAGLPTSWRWGYGWVVNRGYQPLGEPEFEQIEQLAPGSVHDVEISRAPTIPERQSVSGNYCLDIALYKIALGESQNPVEYRVVDQSLSTSPQGFIQTFRIQTTDCLGGYKAEFLLLRRDACEEGMSELLARGRVRLNSVEPKCGHPQDF